MRIMNCLQELNNEKFLEQYIISNDIFRPFINTFGMWSSLRVGYKNDSLVYDIFDDISATTDEVWNLLIKHHINMFWSDSGSWKKPIANKLQSVLYSCCILRSRYFEKVL